MAQSFDSPLMSFEVAAKLREQISTLTLSPLPGGGYRGTEVFVGPTGGANKRAMAGSIAQIEAAGAGPLEQIHRTKIGRNTSCPCGSGFKFKKCCYARGNYALTG